MYNYRYNELGNIVEETRGGSVFKSLEYDRHNRLAETTVHTSDETLVYTPIYETRDSDNAIYADNAIKGMTLNGIFSQSVDKDKYGRPIKASLKAGRDGCELLSSEYSYLKSKNRLTGIVDTVTHKVHGYDSGKYKYTYDVNGNITSISREGISDTVTVREVCNKCGSTIYETEYEHANGLIAEYEYDGLNRLVRENNYTLGETYTYKYDAAGNILSKSTYDVTSGAVVTPNDVKLYRYASTGWKDKLIVYDGQVVAYDTMGNPWSYRGHTLEWSRIRLLTKWDDIEIEYNASGIRTRKGNTYYELDGSTIISETTYGSTIRYYYGNGGIVGFRYNGNRYYYEKNLMGDIIGIYDESGSKVAGYIYDAWGNCTVQTYGNDARIGEVNPFRYRGYYYDSDIGLYYLKSRYYDAKVGRFINADGIEYLGANGDLAAYNLFAYCSDNPIAFIDESGAFVKLALDLFDRFFTGQGYDTAAFGAKHLDMDFNNRWDSYHARKDCWQQSKGYNPAMDVAFAIGTNMETERFDFAVGEKSYTIWAWKGDYINLGAGAELGIYTGSGFFKDCGVDDAMKMSMTIMYGPRVIANYAPSEKQWWITSFVPKHKDVDPSELTATFNITFNTQEMYEAFKGAMDPNNSNWTYYDNEWEARLIF